jgi:AmmeMemoRadiSam system protein A
MIAWWATALMQSPDELSPELYSERYSEPERRALHQVARASIERGFEAGGALAPDASEYSEALQAERASFVTLRKVASGELRGCVGGLEAKWPLVSSVAKSAFNAAFQDPRFPGLGRAEWPGIELHLSVLSPLRVVTVASERELLDRLRPGVDGLVLSDGRRTATFLPDVWEGLPEPDRFLAELKKKAGWPADHWSPSMRVQLYTSQAF